MPDATAESPAQPAPRLLDKRLLVVTGKGGTGKSTISAALALAAAQRGKKVLVCEVTARERMSELFGKPASGPQIQELAKGLYSVHVRPREAMREYALMTLKYETLYNLVFENKVVRYFLNAAPSLAEIVMLGKVWWHAAREQERGRPRWDLVILDAPATGHGLTLLTVPEVFLSLVADGPLARDMRDMQSLLNDPARCATVICALPEEMPVNEAIELDEALKAHGIPLGPLFLNRMVEQRFSAQERVQVSRGGPQLASAADAADAHEARADLSVRYEQVLRGRIREPLVVIPQIYEGHFGPQALAQVAKAIEAALWSSLFSALQGKRVVCCVGSGGVGKTTTAAAIALHAAVSGKRVLVLTIDPARRLANSLGLSTLGNHATRIEPAQFAQANLPVRGEMFAMMLDLKLTWDELVARTAPDEERRKTILDNRIYQKLSTAMAGSLEYMAMEKVYELNDSGRYDLVVLDTPPTSNALDFLHAPDRILDLLENDAARVVLGPLLTAGKLGLKLFNLGGTFVLKTLARFTGAEFLRDLAGFMVAFEGMYDGFKDRAGKVKALLASKDAAFVLVTSPSPLTIDEALFFHRTLSQEKIATAAVVVNRVERDPRRYGGSDNLEGLREALGQAQIKDAGTPPLSDRLARTLLEQATLSDLDRREVERLSHVLHGSPLLRVPRLRKDVHDLAGLWQIAGYLAGEED